MNEPFHVSRSDDLVKKFTRLWEQKGKALDVLSFLQSASATGVSPQECVGVVLFDQSQRWQHGCGLPVEQYLQLLPDIVTDVELQMRIVTHEFCCRTAQGEHLDLDDFLARFPNLPSDRLRPLLQNGKRDASIDSTFDVKKGSIEVQNFSTTATYMGKQETPREADIGATHIGRYRIDRLLNQGAFGKVYLAFDEELDRRVAIKVPRRERVERPEDLDPYIDEARYVAKLDHPNIVPVYDVGRTDDGLCYVVSMFIEGADASTWHKQSQRSPKVVAEVVEQIARALHYAHTQRFIHRDVKPANILIAPEGHAYLADFGVALPDSKFGSGPTFSGTPAYMSPEQAAGKSHLVDGRSDIFSLGVVLYEFLTGTLPFRGENTSEVIERIQTLQPRPLRQIRDTIPRELEQICLKCLEKKSTDRYLTASDLARDLRHWSRPQRRFLTRRTVAAGTIGSLVVIAMLVVFSLTNRATNEKQGAASTQRDRIVSKQDLSAQIKQFRLERDRELLRKGTTLLHPMSNDTAEVVVRNGVVSMPAPFHSLENEIREAHDARDEKNEFNLLLRASNQLIDAGYPKIAEAVAKRMVDMSGNNPSRRPFAYGQLGLAQYRDGRELDAITSYSESNKDYRKIFEKLKPLPKSPALTQNLSAIARLYGLTLMRIGNANKKLERSRAAHTSYEEAMGLFLEYDRESELITLLMNYGSLESEEGNHERAIMLLKQALQTAVKLKDNKAVAEVSINLGNTYSRDRNLALAIDTYEKARQSISLEDVSTRSTLLVNWILALLEYGHIDEAQDKARELRQIGDPQDKDVKRVLELVP